jgi:hypothetical protein
MAKKKEEVKAMSGEVDETPVEAPEAPKLTPVQPPKGRPEGIAIGRIVHFYREKTGQQGVLETFPAIILSEAAAVSAFQPKDGAIDIKIFTRHGDEVRSGVMYAHEGPKAGRWAWPPRV